MNMQHEHGHGHAARTVDMYHGHVQNVYAAFTVHRHAS
jgi:hypothetical protein